MNQAVTSTNVVLNMAISLTLWLIPNNLIIVDTPIVGYSNKLKVSNENMNFGLNKDVNYYGVKNDPPKKEHQESLTNHLDTINNNKPQKVNNNTTKKEDKNIQFIKENSDNHNTELMTILTITGIAAFLTTKYII